MTKTFQVQKDQTKQIILNQGGEYQLELVGEGAHAEVLGAFHLQNKDALKVIVNIIHQAPHTTADTFIRAVVEDQAKAYISGQIIVAPGAQQTNSFLTENVLLTSTEATAEAVPNLEIEANDVKCSHAATVGTIDEEQLFYLQSRGISEKRSRQMIIEGFLAPVLERINKS